MITFENVTKIYKNNDKHSVCALDDVSFTIDKGEFVFLIGPSGAGKTTVTKLMLREENSTAGRIRVNGFDVSRLKKHRIPYLRRSVGTVFQDFRLLPNKTVYENVAFALEVVGAPIREIRRNVPNVLSMVGLTDKAKMKPHQLSGGEQQRVSLARAMVNKPPIILADEPTGDLDPATAMEIMKLLEAFNNRGTTVVVVTHAKDLVDTMQKRVLEIDGGKLVRDEQKGAYENESFGDEKDPVAGSSELVIPDLGVSDAFNELYSLDDEINALDSKLNSISKELYKFEKDTQTYQPPVD